MKYSASIISFTLLVSLLLSCEEEPNQYPFVYITPEAMEIDANSGKYTTFNIRVSSDHVLDKFIISEKRVGSNETTILDSNIQYKSFNYTYDYLFPIDYTEDELTLYFKAININGDMYTARKILKLGTGSLQEITGIKMYTQQSDKEYAFNLAKLESISGNADSLEIDIIDTPTDELSETPSLRWSSYTDVQFVSFNGFDYSKASAGSIKNAFESGQKLTEITAIKEEDIILVKSTDENFFAIKITRIVDNTGVTDDFYEFNIKSASASE